MSCCFNTGYAPGQNFVRSIANRIGETVTIFTPSGGPSGCGFTGVILSVNCNFVRLVTQQGTPPANPLAENICPNLAGDDFTGVAGGVGAKVGAGFGVPGVGGIGAGVGVGIGGGTGCGPKPYPIHTVGSVCDIPIDRIAAICYNAV